MGTRSLTVINDEDGKEIAVLYRQSDGYPSGHGQELADFLKGFTVGNGLHSDDPTLYANGMGCLAAQIVAHFKDEPGGFYLYPAGSRDVGEGYVYTVRPGRLRVSPGFRRFRGLALTCSDSDDVRALFDGDPATFNGEVIEKEANNG